jgi:ubiquinone biosynthesis accessory factor UbiJ
MKNFFLNAITKALNTYLRLDPDSKLRLKKLQGKTIAVELLPFHLTFQCVFTAHGMKIHTDDVLVTDAKISGTPLQMLNVMMTKENRQRFFADDLSITGDAEIAQQVVDLFDELQIDWEEYLSMLVGDVPAHQVGRFIKNIETWLRKSEESFIDNVNEYVHEEAQWLPASEALQDFFAEIDTLRMDVDRIEARVNKLLSLYAENE